MLNIKKTGLALMAAVSLSFVGSQAFAAPESYQLAETSISTVETTTEILPEQSTTTDTQVYRSETAIVDRNDVDVVDNNDAEMAGLSLTTLLIFALLAFSVVAVVIAMSRRERTVV